MQTSTSSLSSGTHCGGAPQTLSPPSSSSSHHPGWRLRLWHFLFRDEDTAGVEGAALHYQQRTSTTAAEDATEPWHYMQVPLSRVILFLRLQQRLAEDWVQGWFYAPFYVFLLLFVFSGPGRGGAQTVADFDAARRRSLAPAPAFSSVRELILAEAFRLDSEHAVEPTMTNGVGNFVVGNSARHPWLYSWYNETINAWTPPPNRRVAVDVQVESVAATHHEPIFLSLTSVRSRRDVLRWLQLQMAPRLWNCERPSFERPWRDTVTGAHYQLGAVRLISRRYREHNREVATLLVYKERASPPEIPAYICGITAQGLNTNKIPQFLFDYDVGGYVALLPFSSSCKEVREVLSTMETPKKSVLWPPSYKDSLEMRAAWMMYTETNRAANTSIAEAGIRCNSFIFDPAVSEVVVQYVEYGTKTNQYTVTEASFKMSSGGAVVRPRLSTYVLHALQWRFTFTPLALSISLALMILVDGNLLGRSMVDQYRRRVARIARQRRSRSQRLWCALRVASQTQSLVHVLALVTSAATVGSWWHSLMRLTAVPDPRYSDRDVYPQVIDAVVRSGSFLLPRLGASAVFFATLALVRFTTFTPGLWICVQTVARSVPRLLLIFTVWMTVSVGVAMLCVLMYGTALYEFRCFGAAFAMLLFAFLDGGRSMMNSFIALQQRGHYAIFAQDSSLPGIRGSRSGRIEPLPMDQRAVALTVSSPHLFPLFLLFFFYFQSLVLLVWGVLTILESYRGVLLLPEAEAVPLWRGLWALRFFSVTRIASAEYMKETIRRILLAREESVMLREMEYYLRLGYARAPATASSTHHGHHHHYGTNGAGETTVSLTMVLWLLPRELQREYGAAHLRRLWYLCVATVVAAQRAEQPWKVARWRQHWEQQPSSLSGWLHASLPEDETLEGQAARVGLQLEELPSSVVRYVECKFM